MVIRGPEGELPRFGNSQNVEINQLLRYAGSNSQRGRSSLTPLMQPAGQSSVFGTDSGLWTGRSKAAGRGCI